MLIDDRLDVRGIHVDAAGDDDVLAAPKKIEKTVLIEPAYIAGAEIIAAHGKLSQVRAPEIAAKKHGRLAHDLPGLAAGQGLGMTPDDLYIDSGGRATHGLKFDLGRR